MFLRTHTRLRRPGQRRVLRPHAHATGPGPGSVHNKHAGEDISRPPGGLDPPGFVQPRARG
nr:hypothetical protein [Kibdelosporangium sp. MJ126-NF4]CTQ89640.1 hypothetical protein [Kibdelosporangium sp. MJ126-NF4]